MHLDDEGRRAAGDASSSDGPAEGAPRGALVVEDNLIVALDTADMLEDAGIAEVRTAATAEGALAMLDDAMPDIALLDVSLADGTSVEVARRLDAAGVPFALVTGYGADDAALAGFPEAPILRKPYAAQELAATVARLGARPG